jgi:hypothetical protein
MRFIFALLILSYVSMAQAHRVKAVSVLPDNRSVIFTLSNYLKEGAHVWVYAKNSSGKFGLAALLKISTCDVDSCTGIVTKIKKGLVLTAQDYYSTEQVKSKVKNGTSSKGTASKGQDTKDHLWLTYGGPLAFGISAAYLKQFGDDFRFGFGAGIVSADIGNVGFSGQYADVLGEYVLWDMQEWQIHPYVQVGYLKTELDFKKVNGSKFSSNAPFAGLGMNLRYEGESWFGIFRGGYSMAMYESSYTDTNGSYTSPVSGGIVIFEVGVGYRF